MVMVRQKRTALRPPQRESLALYVHIPFCETKCPYCDFNTYAGIERLIPPYIDALERELRLWGEGLECSAERQAIGTVFFGGGTPSYLPLEHIKRLMDTVRGVFDLAPEAEVTLESNPGDVTPERASAWKEAGINRLSVGVQSLDDRLLQLLGRRHDAQTARLAFEAARAAGFDNVSLDLMFGLPHQTLDQWGDTLEQTLDLGPDHLSMYCLALEEGTPLEALVRRGVVPEPDPDLAADMYLLGHDLASRAGYERYEVSNWALPGRSSRHNLAYWRNRSYLGVGPGAHSYLDGHRFSVVGSPRRYIRGILDDARDREDGRLIDALCDVGHTGLLEGFERVPPSLEMSETMMMGLRLAEGVSGARFRQRFGVSIEEAFGAQIGELEELGLLSRDGDVLKLTPGGWLLGNEVFQRFL